MMISIIFLMFINTWSLQIVDVMGNGNIIRNSNHAGPIEQEVSTFIHSDSNHNKGDGFALSDDEFKMKRDEFIKSYLLSIGNEETASDVIDGDKNDNDDDDKAALQSERGRSLKRKPDRKCSPDCASNVIGNGVCNPKCNIEECKYDGGDCDSFNIQLEYLANIPSQFKKAFIEAQAHWESIILTDYPTSTIGYKGVSCLGIPIPRNIIIEDLLILVLIRKFDGINGFLGGSFVCGFTSAGNVTQPRIGAMMFDAYDLDALQKKGLLDAVILHEMGHVLGFGTMWNAAFANLISEEPGPPYYYTGANGKIGNQLIGSSGRPVVESIGGDVSRFTHWNEDMYDDELMTSYIDKENYLSILTILSLKDLGYEVNSTMADSFTIGAPKRRLRGDVEKGERKGVKLSNCDLSDPKYPPFKMGSYKSKKQKNGA